MQTIGTYVTVHERLCVEERPDPCGVVIFGASGDLTQRKLIPSLFQLFQRQLIPDNFFVLGCARTKIETAAFQDLVETAVRAAHPKVDEQRLKTFKSLCSYHAGDFTQADAMADLKDRVTDLDKRHQTAGNRLFYLATPPSLYEPLVIGLGEVGLTDVAAREAKQGGGEGPATGGWARVVIEKPHGRDLRSAQALNATLHRVLREDQIYRIDHFLGKETVQNIMMFRFANSIFEPVWNRQHIDHVQITVAESLGIGSRAGYYEQAGLLRDMFQNHLLQVCALVAMEAPVSLGREHFRDEKVKVLESIRPWPIAQLNDFMVRAQYDAGEIDGQSVPGYCREEGVAPESTVETYVAAKLLIDNWRWRGVPFYIRSGKRLAKKSSEVVITFKELPHSMFDPLKPESFPRNQLVLNLQPDEGVELTLQAKKPGPKLCMCSLTMDVNYREVFSEPAGEAYERLLLDTMLGDKALFVRDDDVAVSWALLTPILEAWEKNPAHLPLHRYKAGGWGPAAADELIKRSGRAWRNT